ncbi:UNVERIFIED_CONTAM: hypothetical protein RMT77_015644 [Armadillidium vulgare]
MDKFLKPERFEANPNGSTSGREWNHWYRTFRNFLSSIESYNPNKLDTLINYIAPAVYEYISSCETYEEATEVLTQLYVKPKNEIFARHQLATRRQQSGENLDEFLQVLKQLSIDCNFRAVSAEKNRDDAIRDAFITGLNSTYIRQRLLENKTLELQSAFEQARALDIAQQNSSSYSTPYTPLSASVSAIENSLATDDIPNSSNGKTEFTAAAARQSIKMYNQKCYFCGNKRHPRSYCPARDVICRKCQKKGHYANVCRSEAQLSAATDSLLASIVGSSTTASRGLSKSKVEVIIGNHSVNALIDSGSTHSYIGEDLANSLSLPIVPKRGKVTMAQSSLSCETLGYCFVNFKMLNHYYKKIKLEVLPNLCSELLLGHDVLCQHESVNLQFGGQLPPLNICSLSSYSVCSHPLFLNLLPNCKPIATKSRRYNSSDFQFIKAEIERLLQEGIIEPSFSPWRAQVVVVNNNNSNKKRLVIDYSQTINRYTQLDAYPLPRIDDLVNTIAHHKYFSVIDLKSAYHQVPIQENDKPYTAFEACGKLYQFCRIPFGVTNGVACFQRIIHDFIESNKLLGVYSYLDDLVICGKTEEEHNLNLNGFLEAAKRNNLTINYEKSKFYLTDINWLGYSISHNEIKPDPERLRPLLELPLPSDAKTLKRVVGLFSYYSNWIPKFSEKIQSLVQSKQFPLTKIAQDSFDILKQDICRAVVCSINELIPFVVETDASDFAIAATLNQGGKPVAFFSRTLNNSERKHSSVEKEAYAIVEALRKWKHYLMGHHFTLVTDQKSVSFMFDAKLSGKIKNEKVMRWRIELSPYDFDIIYRPGKDNIPADTLSRSLCASVDGTDSLLQLHNSLCHPEVARMAHFIRCKNLPYSVEDVKRMTKFCSICAECKPRFYKPPSSVLVKASSPFERLNIDFKGPLPSSSCNKYMLTIIDEYSRFPFMYPCSDMSAKTVIRCLSQLFSIFGLPSYVHSDRGTAFMSQELKQFLHGFGVATSRTTPYNPQGNGQCERYNGIIWKTISLALKSRNLQVAQWEQVLPQALHSIRSLLTTSTNETPHERLFNYQRKSSNGYTIPTWLSSPGPVLVRKQVRQSKFDPLVEEAELLEVNPRYAFVRFSNGRESTVSLRDLAPCGNQNTNDPYPDHPENINSEGGCGNNDDSGAETDDIPLELTPSEINIPTKSEITQNSPELRRSSRVCKPVQRLNL